MTAAVYRSTPPLLIPPTQNTAPVLEHNCLFTHDIKRKQKRWNDGFLRYHTFNKRIMIYDVPRNFVGDTHWTASAVIQEGDEVMLDKWGVLVEVADAIGRTETDLSGLRKLQNKARPAAESSRQSFTPDVQRQSAIPTKHRSLNAVLGTPKGVLGRATLHMESPFEERRSGKKSEDLEGPRSAKRLRSDPGPQWSAVRTTKPPLKQPGQASPSRNSMSTRHKKGKDTLYAQSRLVVKEVIDLREDTDDQPIVPDCSSAMLGLPSSSPKQRADRGVKSDERSYTPAFHTFDDSPLKRQSAQFLEHKPASPKSKGQRWNAPHSNLEYVHGSTRSGVDENANMSTSVLNVTKSINTAPSLESCQSVPTASGQFLKVAANLSRKKKTLLCQDQLIKEKLRRNVPHSRFTEADTGSESMLHSVNVDVSESKTKTNPIHAKLRARLARVNRRYPDSARADKELVQGPVLRNHGHNIDETMTHTSSDSANEHVNSVPREGNAVDQDERLEELRLPTEKASVPQGQRYTTPRASPPTPLPARSPSAQSTKKTQRQSKPPKAPGAPMRYTPAPARKSTPHFEHAVIANANEPQKVSKPESRPQSLPKTQQRPEISRNGAATGADEPAFTLSKASKVPTAHPDTTKQMPAPPKPKDVGPWSREAFDLFAWRPPDWDEEDWRIKIAE